MCLRQVPDAQQDDSITLVNIDSGLHVAQWSAQVRRTSLYCEGIELMLLQAARAAEISRQKLEDQKTFRVAFQRKP